MNKILISLLAFFILIGTACAGMDSYVLGMKFMNDGVQVSGSFDATLLNKATGETYPLQIEGGAVVVNLGNLRNGYSDRFGFHDFAVKVGDVEIPLPILSGGNAALEIELSSDIPIPWKTVSGGLIIATLGTLLGIVGYGSHKKGQVSENLARELLELAPRVSQGKIKDICEREPTLKTNFKDTFTKVESENKNRIEVLAFISRL